MVETHWDDLRETELRYHDHTWSLTGDVEIGDSGNYLALEATQQSDTRRKSATLYFGLQNPPSSLNPGSLGDHFSHLERSNGDQFLVVTQGTRTYRYRLQRLKYE